VAIEPALVGADREREAGGAEREHDKLSNEMRNRIFGSLDAKIVSSDVSQIAPTLC
jgi:outer membrane lipopolysaccharide assembly protein LptE/RlpB